MMQLLNEELKLMPESLFEDCVSVPVEINHKGKIYNREMEQKLRYQVHRNLTRGKRNMWSIKGTCGIWKQRVCGYARTILINELDFKVNLNRVHAIRNNGDKEVCALVHGDLLDASMKALEPGLDFKYDAIISFNPFVDDTFVYHETKIQVDTKWKFGILTGAFLYVSAAYPFD
jgi:hypothetical protein